VRPGTSAARWPISWFEGDRTFVSSDDRPSGGIWKLWRDEPGFSPLDFSQRFTGTLSDGRWEHDVDLT
jgi:hypothetical protein